MSTRDELKSLLFLRAALPLVKVVREDDPFLRRLTGNMNAVVQFAVKGTDTGAHLVFADDGLEVVQGIHEKPTVSFYRYLYNTVGEDWLWFERRLMQDDALTALIQDPKIEIYVLYVRGAPAGYVELDCRVENDIEIAYFGLMPEFIGRGFGRYLLDWAVDEAWSKEPQRLWVHTCNLDHPKALASYQRAGFRPYKQERSLIDDPRASGSI